MALRVLLADESSTIKKVFQLALQDFAVEVRPVNVGVDVAHVAQTFKPDIIFADVLLQKRNGYDVSAEIKQDPSLKNIPVVLMWSGFMELDEDKFQASMANAQLEKPFDVAALRKLVTDLVPRTQSQRISQFLNFPKMPDIEMGANAGQMPPPAPGAAAATPEPPQPPNISAEDFAQVPLPKMKGAQNDKYRINLKPEEMAHDHIPVEYDLPSEKVAMEDVLRVEDNEEEPFAIKETKKGSLRPNAPPPPKAPPSEPEPEAEEIVLSEETQGPVRFGQETQIDARMAAPVPQMSAEALEKIIREQSAEVIENIVWKVVPDLAAQIIERELNKLLKERESQPY